MQYIASNKSKVLGRKGMDWDHYINRAIDLLRKECDEKGHREQNLKFGVLFDPGHAAGLRSPSRVSPGLMSCAPVVAVDRVLRNKDA